MLKKHAMVGWYDPGMLVVTGIRVLISTIFGAFADRREAMAAANAIAAQPFDKSFDYSGKAKKDGFWLDFLADTGDGWDSTYAMARLVTAGSLSPAGSATPLPRGRLIVLGGDEVYPTASLDAYRERFLAPFDRAFERAPAADRKAMPDLFAVPGNHDWYDGLGSFLSLFARRTIAAPGHIGIDSPGRKIAGRDTHQTRSYFALKLPGGWWLWGTDSQLSGHIDQPQIDFFRFAARHWMAKGSKVILCVGQPNWAYIDCEDPGPQFETLSYLERLAGIATDADGKPMGHQLKLVLTGDSHHYSRYVSGDVHYVTCGGGGAFLHPTHQLEDKDFSWHYPPPGEPYTEGMPSQRRQFTLARRAGSDGKAVFPDMATSRKLAWRNLAFAWLNPKFTALLLVAYLFFNWLVGFAAATRPEGDLGRALNRDLTGAIHNYVLLLFGSPWPPLLIGLGLAAYYYLADARTTPMRLVKGVTHGVAQTLLAGFTTIVLIRATAGWWHGHGVGPLGAAASLLVASAGAALVSATLFGAYLLLNLQLWGRHWDEAFSSLRIADYKSFLRLHIDAAGRLSLHPVGLTSVPRNGDGATQLAPHLIEGPVTIG